jgi:6-phosphogluconate dehydrogenase
MEVLSDFGFVGLGTMGSNLARNVASRQFRVSVYNRTEKVTDEFIKKYGNDFLVGEKNLKSFVKSIKRPRKIMILIKAGLAVDAVTKALLPHLQKGDIIIDGGNSYYRDTQKRFVELKKRGIHFMGCGVSGGEEGALNGPSLMPGGSRGAWKSTRKIFEAIAADDFTGDPCVTYIGDNGAGHYVKMVHNGIEYAVMQLMSETYSLYRKVYKLSSPKIAKRFEKMNNGKLNSFLFEIAIPVLRKKDEKKGKCCLIYKILDSAGSKGTGKWTVIDALDRGVAVPSIAQAVFSRSISTEKKERVELEKIYPHQHKKQMSLFKFDKTIEDALYAAILSCYAQGYDLIQKAAQEEKWAIDLAEVCRIWEGGCIIRAKLLNIMHNAYQQSKDRPQHVFALPAVEKIMKIHVPQLRKLVSTSVHTGINIPALSSSLYYFEAMTEERLPANFIQGLRDYFGAHTFKRTDEDGNFHAEWVD